jgi:Zn-finger nucleic acid-binding protein
MQCPVCKTTELELAGHTYRCDRCDGAWVTADALVPMLEQQTATLVALDWQPSREEHRRACPVCGAAMPTVTLGTVALDRCEPHGAWFDARELAALLKQAKKFRVAPEHHGLLERLGKLLHRG